MIKWLTWTWRIGHIRGIEIRLHYSVLFSLIIAYLLFRPVELGYGFLALLSVLGFVLSILLHELSHAAVAKLLGVEVKNIVIWLLGGFTNLVRVPEKPLHRLAIDAAGPIMTLLVGILFSVAYYYMANNLSNFWMFAYSRIVFSLVLLNASLFVFNILPVYPLDGGRILHSLSELLFGQSTANSITMIISIPILFGLIMLGVYTHDYILLIFCVVIALAIGTLNRHTLRWINLGINYLFRRGSYYYLQSDYDRAVQYFTHKIKRKPKQANNYVFRAACYLQMLQNEKALMDIQQAFAIAPKNELVLMMRGDICWIEKDPESALEWYERAHQLNPNSALPYFGRGSMRMDKKEFQPALEELNTAISLLSVFPQFFIVRSQVHYRLGNLDRAHQDQDAALRLSEKEALTRAEFNFRAYEGYVDWAEDYYARVLVKQPRSWYAYQGRAEVYRVNQEYDKAIADYTKALEIKPREPSLYLGRGQVYCTKGNLDKAGKDFRQAHAVTDKAHFQRRAKELLESLQQQIEIDIMVGGDI